MFEGDNISITAQSKYMCHILKPKRYYAFTYFEMLGEIVIYESMYPAPPFLQYRFQVY